MYQEIVDQSDSAVVVSDLETRTILYANQAVWTILGMPKETELIGKSTNALYSQGESMLTREMINHLSEEEFWETQIRTASGKFLRLKGKKVFWQERPAYVIYVIDVIDDTPLKEEQNMLETAQKRLEIIQENSNLLIWEIDFQEKKLHPDEHSRQLLGPVKSEYKYPDIIEQTTRIDPQSKQQILDMYQDMIENRNVKPVEFCIQRNNGQMIWLYMKGAVMTRKEGVPTRGMIWCRDITEQKQIETIYINRISRSLNISDKTEVAFVFDLDENRIIESSSNNYEMFARLQQIKVDEYLKNICDASEDPQRLSQVLNVKAMKKAYELGNRRESVQYYNRIKRQDFECSYELLKNPYSGHIESFVSFQNITEDVKLEKVMQSLIKMNYVAIYTVDMKTMIPTVYSTTEGGRIQKIREEGRNYRQYIEHYLKKLGVACNEEKVRQENDFDVVQRELEENSFYTTQFGIREFETKGKLRQFSTLYRYLDARREVLLIVLRDVTVEYEQERREKLKLEIALKEAEEANAAKTDFLSRMSHDIRTPMNAIMGLVQLAEAEELTPKAREYMDKIGSSSEFLLRLVNDILDMSKIENGELEFHLEPFTPQKFYQEIQTIIQPLMNQKNIKFHLTMSDRTQTLMMDRLRFNQIFFNLLSNAVKFTPEGGDIYLFSEMIAGTEDKLGFRFHVKDTGIGMSEEFQQRVFEPFEQESNDIVNNTQGTGLGTTIVKRIVEAMGGKIQVRSQQGVGTEFIVDLYFTPGDPEQLPSPGNQMDQIMNYLAGKKVLLVEDNELNVLVARAQLKKAGVDVTVAENGLEAVKYFQQKEKCPFDAILMDRRMPVMDGLQATREIRKIDKKTPIIAMTADAFNDDAQISLEAGMDAHLTKPVVPDKLYRTLASCMILQ